MSSYISIYLNIDRVFVTVVEASKQQGLTLKYINSTEKPLDLENLYSPNTHLAIEQLKEIVNEITQYGIVHVNIILPAEVAHVTQFPSDKNQDRKDISKMIAFELQHIYPGFDFNNFAVRIYNAKSDKGREVKIGIILTNELLSDCENIFNNFGLKIKHYELSQFAAHSAFLFNYPELKSENIVLAGFQKQFIDISVINGSKLLYYNLVSISGQSNISEIMEKEFNNLQVHHLNNIKSAFYFGSGLTRDINLACWETAMLFGFESKRLNPFRLLRTNLDERTKEYCSRTFQCYPAAIGGFMKSAHSYNTYP